MVSKRQIRNLKAQVKKEMQPAGQAVEINIVSVEQEGEGCILRDYKTGETVETLTQEEYEEQVQAGELLELEWEDEE